MLYTRYNAFYHLQVQSAKRFCFLRNFSWKFSIDLQRYVVFGLHWFCMVRKLLSFYEILNFEFCEISKNTFLTEHLWTTASVIKNFFRNFFCHIRTLCLCFSIWRKISVLFLRYLYFCFDWIRKSESSWRHHTAHQRLLFQIISLEFLIVWKWNWVRYFSNLW